MAEEKREYELTVIVDGGTEEKTRKDLMKKIAELIKKAKGETTKKEDWGSKEFAYPIKGKSGGIYWFFQFKMNPSELESLKEKIRLEENITRFLLIKI